MKKIIICFAIIFCVCFLIACNQNNLNGNSYESANNQNRRIETIEDRTTPADSGLFIIKSDSGLGETDELQYNVIVEKFSETKSETDYRTMDTLPVFYYKYGNGQGGPFISFTVDDNLIIKNRAKEIVSAVFGEDALSHLILKDEKNGQSDEVSFIVNGDFEQGQPYSPCSIKSMMYFTSISFREKKVEELSDEWDEILKSILKYMEFNNIKKMVYSDQHDITEHITRIVDSDEVSASSGRKAEVAYKTDSEGNIVYLHITNIEFSEKVDEAEVIPLNRVIEFLKEKYNTTWKCNSDDDLFVEEGYEKVTCEINERLGIYYVPVYKVYIPNNGVNGEYAIVSVSAINSFEIN